MNLEQINFKKYGIVLTIILSCMILIFSAYIFSKTYDGDNKEHLTLHTPYGIASVHIDKFGVPHIEGETDLSAFFALGYMHMKDRAWQMEFQRHAVKGTLSELFGKYTVEQDKYLRTWGFYQAAKDDWKYFNNKTKAIIDSYSAGVNTFLKRNISSLELALLFHKPEQWLVYDSYAWGKFIAWQQENIWQDKIVNYILLKKYSSKDVLSITQEYPSSAPTTLSRNELNVINKLNSHGANSILPIDDNNASNETNQFQRLTIKNINISHKMNIELMPGKGSNAWVISGQLTKSGKPILANDVHLELSSPGIWYLADIKSPNFHAVGATLPGSPAVLIGHNNSIAWGVTDAGVDAQDVYILSPTEKILSHNELIRVRGQNQPIVYEVKVSKYGPIISTLLEDKYFTKPIAVKWTALLPADKTIQSFLKINYAYNWLTFREALKDFVSPPLNFFYTDTKGNIGYYLPGKIPIRRNWSGRYPVIDSKKCRWEGYIPFSKLPHTFNPSKGYIVSANNKPVPDTYPYELTYHWREMPYRAERIIEVLTKKGVIDVPTTIQMQLDIKCKLWEKFKRILLNVVPLNQDAKEAVTLLRDWDGNMDKVQVAPTIFAFWFERIKTLQPNFNTYLFHLPNPEFILRELETNGDFCVKQGYKNCKDFLSQTLSLTILDMKNKLGKNKENWQWGHVHKAIFKGIIFGDIKLAGQLWNQVVSTNGGAYTVNMGAYNTNFNQIGAAMYRQVIDMNNLGNGYYIIAPGQSGNLYSKHYSDLLNMWRDGRYLRM